MSKRDVAQVFRAYPGLAKAWDEYGFEEAYSRDKLVDVKLSGPGHFYAAFLAADGQVIDFAGRSVSEWECQNDGSEPLTPAQFKKLYVPSGCDWTEGWPEQQEEG